MLVRSSNGAKWWNAGPPSAMPLSTPQP